MMRKMKDKNYEEFLAKIGVLRELHEAVKKKMKVHRVCKLNRQGVEMFYFQRKDGSLGESISFNDRFFGG